MVESCAAMNCTNRRKKKTLKFHKIPKDLVMRQKWIHALGRSDYNPGSRAVICEKHFQEKDYELNPYRNRVLKKEAVPSIFNFPSGLQTHIKEPKHLISPIIDENESDNPVTESEELNNVSNNDALERSDDNPGSSAVISEENNYEINVHGNRVLKKEVVPLIFNFPSCLQTHIETPIELIRPTTDEKELENPVTEVINVICELSNVSNNDVHQLAHTAPMDIVEEELQLSNDDIDAAIPTPPPREIKLIRNRRDPYYFGDFMETDLDCEVKRKRFWRVAQETVGRYKKANKGYQLKIRRQMEKIENLKTVMLNLVKEVESSTIVN